MAARSVIAILALLFVASASASTDLFFNLNMLEGRGLLSSGSSSADGIPEEFAGEETFSFTIGFSGEKPTGDDETEFKDIVAETVATEIAGGRIGADAVTVELGDRRRSLLAFSATVSIEGLSADSIAILEEALADGEDAFITALADALEAANIDVGDITGITVNSAASVAVSAAVAAAVILLA